MDTKQTRLLSEINTIETDYRAEVVASAFLNAGQKEGKVVIVRKGGGSKDVAKDIAKVSTEFSGLDLMEYLYIHTNRYGIYDALPEGIFHQPQSRRRSRSRQDVLEDIRVGRTDEFHARRFFRPFEMIIDRLLVDARIYEQQFDKAYAYENLKVILEEHWDILQYLSVKQTLLFLKAVPLIAGSGRSFPLMASIMRAILDCPVKIEEGKKSELEVAEEERSSLRNLKLGVNLVMGKAVITNFPDLNIIIGPTGARQVRDFQRNKNNLVILDKLIEMIIPFDRNVTIKYEVFEAEKRFRLSDGTHKAYLGVNTTI